MPHIHIHVDLVTGYLAYWLAVLGAAAGSFLDCIAWRRARGESAMKGRSHCGDCGHELSVRDLIPVFSYLFSRGKCRYCGAKIPREALAAELAGAALFAGCTLKYGPVPELAMWLIFLSILLLLSLIDCEQRVLPDGFLLLAAANRLVFWLLLDRSSGGFLEMLIGAFSVSVPLLLAVLAMDRILKRETMGGGDIKLVFVTGLYLNWKYMILMLFAACILGVAGGLLELRARKRRSGQEDSGAPDAGRQGIAFGPCLAAAAALALLFGQPVVEWYSGLLH